jgi:hypothetical protein
MAPACCQLCSGCRESEPSLVMLPAEPHRRAEPITNTRLETNFAAVDMMDNASALPTCPQRATKEDSSSKLVQNHPLVCLKRLFLYPPHSFIILFNFSVVSLIVHPVHKDLCSQVDESGVTV